MWITFIDDYTWCPTPMSAIAYRAGMTLRVPRACAEAALAAGKAIRAKRQARKQD